MKRDMDLFRLILVEAEKLPASPEALNVRIQIPGYEYESIAGHIQLLDDAGLVKAQDWGSNEGIDWRIERLTNKGHDFLAAARDDTLWNQMKALMKSKLATVGLDVIGEVLLNLARARLVKAGLLP